MIKPFDLFNLVHIMATVMLHSVKNLIYLLPPFTDLVGQSDHL